MFSKWSRDEIEAIIMVAFAIIMIIAIGTWMDSIYKSRKEACENKGGELIKAGVCVKNGHVININTLDEVEND